MKSPTASLAAARWARALGFAAVLGAVGTAHAGLFDDDEARRAILELRQRVEVLSEQQKSEQTKHAEQLELLRRSLLDLNSQLELMRSDVAKLRGQNEQATREFSEMQRKQTDLQAAIDERMRQFEPQKQMIDGKEIQVRPEERRDYEAALDVFRKGDFAGAVTAFTGFQRRYPGSGYEESVLYWLGNAHYGKRDYEKAIASFRALANKSPGHERTPEALLSVAMCQIELKDRVAARRTLDELIKSHPSSEAAQEAKVRLATLK